LRNKQPALFHNGPRTADEGSGLQRGGVRNPV
jgi:hypothetical protein